MVRCGTTSNLGWIMYKCKSCGHKVKRPDPLLELEDNPVCECGNTRIKYGITSTGKQKYYCRKCGTTTRVKIK